MGQYLNCDFCSKPVLPGCGITVVGNPIACQIVGPLGSLGIDHSAEWLACGHCARFIEAGAWESLILRVQRCLQIREDKPMELLLRVTYSKAFQLPELITAFVSPGDAALSRRLLTVNNL